MQCEDRSRRIPGRFGFLRVQCQRTIALSKWRDETGREHQACAAHFPALERRYPMVEPTWLHEDPAFALMPAFLMDRNAPGKASSRCESGSRYGCTCDVCW